MEDKNRYVIHGGYSGKVFYARMHDKLDIAGFSDNNPCLWGSSIDVEDMDGSRYRVPCMAPGEVEKDMKMIAAAAPGFYPEILKQMQQLRLECISADQFVCEYFADKIQLVEEWLADDASRQVYRQVIEGRSKGDLSLLKQAFSPDQYFAVPEFRNFSGQEIFVDAGSFCGDILDTYILSRCGLFQRIYAFEPGGKQFHALQCRAQRLRKEWALEEEQIICVNGAVSDYNGTCSFEVVDRNIATSRMGMKESGGIPVYKLDSFLTDGADFIKADIEGQEMALLRGAEETIQKFRPKLAVCLYHTPFDLFEIPMYVREMVPDYKMEVRHHSYNTSETVLYAYCR